MPGRPGSRQGCMRTVRQGHPASCCKPHLRQEGVESLGLVLVLQRWTMVGGWVGMLAGLHSPINTVPNPDSRFPSTSSHALADLDETRLAAEVASVRWRRRRRHQEARPAASAAIGRGHRRREDSARCQGGPRGPQLWLQLLLGSEGDHGRYLMACGH